MLHLFVCQNLYPSLGNFLPLFFWGRFFMVFALSPYFSLTTDLCCSSLFNIIAVGLIFPSLFLVLRYLYFHGH